MPTPEIFTGLFVLIVPVTVLILMGWFMLKHLNRRDKPRRRNDDPGESLHPRPSSPAGSEWLVPRYGSKAMPLSTRHPAAPGHFRQRQPQDVDAWEDDGITIPPIKNPAVSVTDSPARVHERPIRGTCASGGFTQDDSKATQDYSPSDSSLSSDTSSSSSCE
jgi:hypothetical protein